MQLEDDGKANFGLKAELETEVNHDWIARENSTVAKRPTLTVIYQVSGAYALSPVNNETDVHPNVVITWNTDPNTATEEVYFDGGLVATNTVGVDLNEYDPSPAGELALGATHTYQIKSFDGGGQQIGETTVHSFTVMALHPDVPVNVTPLDGSVDVPIHAEFDFVPGEDATSTGQHNLWIGTVSGGLSEALSDVSPGDALNLLLGTEYFWQIEAVGTGGTYLSDETSFTTADFDIIEDFDDPNGVFTGGVSDTDVTEAGDGSMRIDYTAGTTTVSRTFGTPQDLSGINAAALQLYYKGWDATNAQGSLTVELSDGTTTGSVVLADVLVAETWTGFEAWDIDLADFGIDLSNVVSMSPGLCTAMRVGVCRCGSSGW
jgi:hypothetical protein